MRRRIAVTVVAVCVALSGCSSSDDTTSDVTTTAAAISTTSTIDVAALPPMPGGALQCAQFAQTLNAVGTASVGGVDGPLPSELSQYRADLPPELQADLDVFMAKHLAIEQATDGDAARAARLGEAELVDASDHLSTYLEGPCIGAG